MRKKLLILCSLTAIAFGLHAQTTGGPDAYGYIWRDNNDAQGPAYNWVEIDGLSETIEVTSSLTDDNVVGPFSLPAPFHYYWYDVSSFRIGSNGYITFAANTNIASGATGFPSIPGPGTTNNEFIAGMMTDLLFTGTPGRCYYYIPPTNDSVIVTYDSVPFWDNVSGYVGSNTFQIILAYADSSITINYKEQVGASATGFVSTGIENNSGTIGLQHLYNVYPTSQTSVKYYPPATTTLQINDASTVYNDNPDNGAVFLSKDGAPYTLVTEVKNTGNQPLATFNVQSQVRNASNQLQVTNTQAAGPLNPGQTQMISMASPFVPTVAGGYFFRTDTQLAGDATPSNNRKDVELQVIDTTQATVELAYENATSNTGTVSWSGGDGGMGVYMKPSFAPFTLTAAKAYIVNDATNLGYHMIVFDDDGPNGEPGTMLDSVFVPGGTFSLNTFTTTTFTTPLTFSDGGFYLCWYMGGNGVTLGTVTTTPISFRTYEVLLAPTPSNFAAYRERETEDLMLRAVIDGVVGVSEIEKGELFGNAYPNPATDAVHIDFDLSATSEAFTMHVYNAKGQMVYSAPVNAKSGKIEINTSQFEAGIYSCKLESASHAATRRFTVVK